jgi:hypothetical protein
VSSTRSHGSRTQTKWLEDKLTTTRLDDNFWPTPNAAIDRFVLVCGLIARGRVSVNKAVDDLSPFETEQVFTVLEENLDYPANLENLFTRMQLRQLCQSLQPCKPI